MAKGEFEWMARDAAQRIIGLVDPAASYDAVVQAVTTVVEVAIGKALEHRRQYSCRVVCPGCFKTYVIHVSLRGRPVKCTACGYSWRTPEPAERNVP